MCRISTSASVTRRSKNQRAKFRNQHKEQCSIQCVANDTKPDHTTIDPHRRTSNPKSSQITAKTRNSTHAPGTYTGMHLPVIRRPATRHLHSHTIPPADPPPFAPMDTLHSFRVGCAYVPSPDTPVDGMLTARFMNTLPRGVTVCECRCLAAGLLMTVFMQAHPCMHACVCVCVCVCVDLLD